MKISILFAAFFFIFVPPLLSFEGNVTRVIDGDTLEILTVQNRQIRVRLYAVDAPEKAQPYYQKSKENLEKMCAGEPALVAVMNADRYERIVGVVYCQGLNAGLEQAREGYAWVYEFFAAQDSNSSSITHYHTAQTNAKIAKQGIWQDKSPTPPWDFRRKKGTESASIPAQTSVQ